MKRLEVIGIILVILCFSFFSGVAGYNLNDTEEIKINTVKATFDDEINFVELFFPDLPVDNNNCPLGAEVFALSFIVNQYHSGEQTYGGRNLVAEVVKGPYNHNRFLGMSYNYFVGPDVWTNYNVTLVVRDGICVDYDIENLEEQT